MVSCSRYRWWLTTRHCHPSNLTRDPTLIFEHHIKGLLISFIRHTLALTTHSLSDNDTSHDPSYKDGFKRCIQETANAILSTPVPEDVKRHFISQLSVLNLGHDSYTPLTPEYDRAELCSPAKPHLTDLPRHHPMAHQPIYPPQHIHHSSSSAFAPHTSIKEEPRPFGSDNSGQFNIPQSGQSGQFNPQNGQLQSGLFHSGMPRIKAEVRSPEQQASTSSAEPGIWRPWWFVNSWN